MELLSCKGVEPDAEISSLLKNVHDASMEASNREIGEVSQDFYADPMWLPHIPKEILHKGPILNLVHSVMKANSGADVTTAC